MFLLSPHTQWQSRNETHIIPYSHRHYSGFVTVHKAPIHYMVYGMIMKGPSSLLSMMPIQCLHEQCRSKSVSIAWSCGTWWGSPWFLGGVQIIAISGQYCTIKDRYTGRENASVWSMPSIILKNVRYGCLSALNVSTLLNPDTLAEK